MAIVGTVPYIAFGAITLLELKNHKLLPGTKKKTSPAAVVPVETAISPSSCVERTGRGRVRGSGRLGCGLPGTARRRCFASCGIAMIAALTCLGMVSAEAAEAPGRTLFLFLTHQHSSVEQQRVHNLQSYLPQFDVRVVWGGTAVSPWNDTLETHVLSSTHKFNYVCCTLELAIMWLIDHTHTFDYVWTMENDVAFNNPSAFGTWMGQFDHVTSDLIHQNPNMEARPYTEDEVLVWHFQRLASPIVDFQRAHMDGISDQARFEPPYYAGMYQFYRMSRRMVQELGSWYRLNGQRWVFFEPLIGTLAMQKNLSISHLQDATGCDVHMQWRPCWDQSAVDGLVADCAIVHPYKTDSQGRTSRADCSYGSNRSSDAMTPVWLLPCLAVVAFAVVVCRLCAAVPALRKCRGQVAFFLHVTTGRCFWTTSTAPLPTAVSWHRSV